MRSAKTESLAVIKCDIANMVDTVDKYVNKYVNIILFVYFSACLKYCLRSPCKVNTPCFICMHYSNSFKGLLITWFSIKTLKTSVKILKSDSKKSIPLSRPLKVLRWHEKAFSTLISRCVSLCSVCCSTFKRAPHSKNRNSFYDYVSKHFFAKFWRHPLLPYWFLSH